MLSLSRVAFLARKSASAVNTAAAAPSRRCARRGPLRPHSAPTRAARRARPLARHTQSGPASAPLLCLADVPCLARRRARCALGPSAPLRPGRPRSAPRLARAPQPPALARPGKAASRLRERRAKVPRRGRCAPPSAAAAGSVVAVIFNNDHYVIRSRRSVSYEAGVLAEMPSVSCLFSPETVFLCRSGGSLAARAAPRLSRPGRARAPVRRSVGSCVLPLASFRVFPLLLISLQLEHKPMCAFSVGAFILRRALRAPWICGLVSDIHLGKMPFSGISVVSAPHLSWSSRSAGALCPGRFGPSPPGTGTA